MKICGRGLNWIQIINARGDVIGCSWAKNNDFGNILQSDWKEIINSGNAKKFREKLLMGDYSNCSKERCRFLANDTLEEHMVEYDGSALERPAELYLAYENICNYRCSCCSSHELIEEANKEGGCRYNYEKIEKKVEEVMPYLKTFGANGCGELFVSKSILKLLSKWEPLYPKEEVSVRLETNGSLFNEEHWKQIENLGKYRLRVAITVMSFNERVYQYLSGTKYPITKIENNLKFVKDLRETGVIDELELATVLQEANFREMPEFTRRCIEEFGADSVRLRAIFPGGYLDENIQWFMDVRNPLHPYYQEYKSIMQDGIFNNPKVCKWSGEEDSPIGELPLKKEADNLKKNLDLELRVSRLLRKLAMCDDLSGSVSRFLSRGGVERIAIYGYGVLGKAFIKKLNIRKVPIEFIIDKNCAENEYGLVQTSRLDRDKLMRVDGIIITSIRNFDEIRAELKNYEGKIFSLEQVLCEEG